jgi:hypothetical protein
MGVCAWKDFRECYHSGLTVQVPARPGPILPKSFVDFKQGRAIIHFVFMESMIKPAIPVYVKAFTVNWPGDKEKKFSDSFNSGGLKIKYSFSVNLHPSGSSDAAYYTGGSVTNLEIGFVGIPSYSLVQYLPQRLQMLVFATPLADDDPLRAVNLDTFEDLYKAKMARMVYPTQSQPLGDNSSFPLRMRSDVIDLDFEQNDHGRHQENQAGSPYIPIALATYWGGSAVVFLLAAGLLSQVFSRRHLALAGMMVIVLLYVAGLDRAVLNAHSTRLNDAKASMRVRLLACRQMQNTFFYRHTAQRQLGIVIADKQTPPAVSDMARSIQGRLMNGK